MVAGAAETGLWGQAYSPMGEKGRFVLPTFARKKIRESSSKRTLCLAQDNALPCLIGFGLGRVAGFEAQLDAEEDRAVRRNVPFNRTTRAAQLYGFTEIGFDDSGRFILPEHLVILSGVEDGLYFHGAGGFMTVWTPARLAAMGDDWLQAKVTCQGMVEAARAKAARK